MRFLRIAGFAALLCSCQAHAADLPSRGLAAPAPFIAPLPVFSWTGFYIGGNIGGGFGVKDPVGIHIDPGNAFLGDFGTLQPSGVFGGVQAGYNLQLGRIVLGAETDFEASGIEGKAREPSFGGINSSNRLNYFGSARARLGYAFDRVLVYGTAGLAYEDFDYKVVGGSPAGFNAILRDHSTRLGLAAGGGVEYAFTNNLSLKLEYQFIGFTGKTIGAPIYDGVASTLASARTVETLSMHTGRIGLNYRF